MRSAPLVLLIAVGLGLVGLSCSKDSAPLLARSSVAAPAPTASTAEADKVTGGKGMGKDDVSKQVVSPRKIIRNGEVRMVVKTYAPARKQIERLVRKSDGFISKSEVRHSLGRVSSATIVLRVPTGRFDGLVASVLRLGVVEHEAIRTKDITEAYYDLKARLSNAKKLEARFLVLLEKKADKVTELLVVEKELARVREKIERFEGKLRLYDNLVNLSTLTINLSIRQKYTPPTPRSFGDDAGDTFSGSIDAMKQLGRGLILMLVALLPWLIPMGLIAYLTWWLIRRSIRRRRARREDELKS